MCDPVTLTAVALVGAGTAAQAEGQGEARHASKAATAAEIRRQGVIRDKSYASEADTLKGVSRPVQDTLQGNAERSRAAAYVAPIGGPSPTGGPSAFVSPLTPSNPAIAAEFNRQGANQQSKSIGEALAKAKLDSYGDANLVTGFRTQRNAQDIGFNTREAQASNAVLPYELEASKRKGAGMRALGDALTMAGSVVGMGGAGLFGGGAGATTFGSDFGPGFSSGGTAFA
jgi:hypothetical protein